MIENPFKFNFVHRQLMPLMRLYSGVDHCNFCLSMRDDALERAERECEGDAAQREMRRAQAGLRRAELDDEYIRHFAVRIREVYPHCPSGREALIAEHACRKYSGRVGRSAAAKVLDEQAVRLAVTAHVRHAETKYDDLLLNGFERGQARSAVQPDVTLTLSTWEYGGS